MRKTFNNRKKEKLMQLLHLKNQHLSEKNDRIRKLRYLHELQIWKLEEGASTIMQSPQLAILAEPLNILESKINYIDQLRNDESRMIDMGVREQEKCNFCLKFLNRALE